MELQFSVLNGAPVSTHWIWQRLSGGLTFSSSTRSLVPTGVCMIRQASNVPHWLLERVATVNGPRGSSQNLVALFVLSFVARVAADQDLSVAAASLELTVRIAAKMALDGATSLLETVQCALAASTLARALRHVLAAHPALHPALSEAEVAAASGVVTAVIVVMMARVGATSRAPIVQLVQDISTVVLGHQHADELVE